MTASRSRGAAAGAVGAGLSYAVLSRRAGAGWQRRNFRDRPVTLAAGPAAVVGSLLGGLAAVDSPRRTLATLLAVAPAGVAGGYDDRCGSRSARGLGGHLGALARGEVTTGAVKVAAIGCGALAAGCVLDGPGRDALLTATLVAGTANLVNLLDLRPGRAAKAVIVLGLMSRGRCAAGAVGAAAALLPADLGERAMLGDAGANALGASVGVALAGAPRLLRRGLLVAVVGLTLANERVSFSAVIEATPALRRVDALGRLP